MRNRIFDSPFKTRMDVRFINKSKLSKVIYDSKYQIIEVCLRSEWIKKHITGSVNLTPINFQYQYEEKISKTRKIVLYGDWRRLVKYYRLLDFKNYKVYLIK